jgi:hypothetical protein
MIENVDGASCCGKRQLEVCGQPGPSDWVGVQDQEEESVGENLLMVVPAIPQAQIRPEMTEKTRGYV